MNFKRSWKTALALALAVVVLSGFHARGANGGDKPLKPLKVAVYSTIAPVFSSDNIKAVARQMNRPFSKRINYPIGEVEIIHDADYANLMAFASRLDKGEFHLAWMGGMEYAWLQSTYPDLKPLVVTDIGEVKSAWNHILIVRHDDAAVKSIADLRGKKLARFKTAPFINDLTLSWMLHNDDNLKGENNLEIDRFFDVSVPEFSTGKRAVFAVVRKECDCAVIRNFEWAALKNIQSNVIKRLRVVALGPDNPPPVQIGNPAKLNGLRKGLWDDVQQESTQIHNHVEGKELLKFFGVIRWSPPDKRFAEQVNRCNTVYAKERNLFEEKLKLKLTATSP